MGYDLLLHGYIQRLSHIVIKETGFDWFCFLRQDSKLTSLRNQSSSIFTWWRRVFISEWVKSSYTGCISCTLCGDYLNSISKALAWTVIVHKVSASGGCRCHWTAFLRYCEDWGALLMASRSTCLIHIYCIAVFVDITFSQLPLEPIHPSLASISTFTDKCSSLSVRFEQIHIVTCKTKRLN